MQFNLDIVKLNHVYIYINIKTETYGFDQAKK